MEIIRSTIGSGQLASEGGRRRSAQPQGMAMHGMTAVVDPYTGQWVYVPTPHQYQRHNPEDEVRRCRLTSG